MSSEGLRAAQPTGTKSAPRGPHLVMSETAANEPSLLPVSAVVATRNRAAMLRRTLDSLAKQSAQPAEIIMVDGGYHATGM